MKKTSFILALFFGILLSFAGSENGNGARAVVIAEGKEVVKVMLTDLWEAAQPVFFPVTMGNQNRFKPIESTWKVGWRKPYVDRARLFMEKAVRGGEKGREIAMLFARAAGELEAYPRKVRYVCGTEYDVKEKALPPVYDVIQAVVTHIASPHRPKGWMCINNLFYTKTDTVNRAAAEFHEVLYYAARNWLHHTTSDRTRRIVGLVFGKDFEKMSPSDLERWMTWFSVKDSAVVSADEARTLLAVVFGRDSALIEPILTPSSANPEALPAKFSMPVDEFVSAYSFSGRNSPTPEALTGVESEKYTCDYGFKLRKEQFGNRGLGTETELFVVPSQSSGFKFAPGSEWFPHGYGEMADARENARFAGPFPSAVFTFYSNKVPFSGKEVAQSTVIRKDLSSVLWSLGGLTGKCCLNGKCR